MRRRVPLRRTVLWTSLLLLLTLLTALLVVRLDRVVLAQGAVTGGLETVRAARAGILERLGVKPGQQVQKGQLLAVLESAEIEADLEASSARLRALEVQRDGVQAECERLTMEAHPDALRVLESELERRHLEEAAASARLQRLETLAADGLVRELELEEARLGRDLTALAIQEGRMALERATREQTGELRRLRSSLEGIEAQIEEELGRQRGLRIQADRSRIVAPVGGIALVDPAERMIGKAFGAGDPILRIATSSPPRFEGSLSDAGRARARVGAITHVRLEAYPWLLHGSVEGTLTFVSEARGPQGGFTVQVQLDDSDSPGPLLNGMRGVARVVLEERVSLVRYLFESLAGREL